MTLTLKKLEADVYEVSKGSGREALVRWADGAATFVVRLAPCDIEMLDDDSAPVLNCNGTLSSMRRAAVHFCNNEELVYDSKEIQLQLDNMPKKRGRPNTGRAMTGAERAKRARDKKRRTAFVTINKTLGDRQSTRYREMLESGLNLDAIVDLAAAVLDDVKYDYEFDTRTYVNLALNELEIEHVRQVKNVTRN